MVEVILVKYNQPEFEDITIKSILRSTTIPYHLTAYQNAKGVSLSSRWNVLIERSDAEYICLLNTDTQVTRGWLRRLLGTFEEYPNAGCVQPSSNAGQQGTIQTPLRRMEMDWDVINNFGEKLRASAVVKVTDVTCCTGFCMMFPRKAWEEAGRFNEEFFLYGEDNEFSRRVKRKLGLRLLCRRDTYVHHYKEQSVKQAVADGDFNLNQVRQHALEVCRKVGDL